MLCMPCGCHRSAHAHAPMTLCTCSHVSHGSCTEEDLDGHTMAVLPLAVRRKVGWKWRVGQVKQDTEIILLCKIFPLCTQNFTRLLNK